MELPMTLVDETAGDEKQDGRGRIREAPCGLSPPSGPQTRRRFLRRASSAFRTAERRTGSLMVQDEQRSSLVVVCVVDW